jgi:F0F1-type ATP synthase assembly protein I
MPRVDPSAARVLGQRRASVTVQYYWKGLGSYGSVGIEIALSVIVGLLAGQWLDKKLGTNGWLTFIGLAYGLAAGGRALYRVLQKANREAEELDRKEREARKKYGDDEKPSS